MAKVLKWIVIAVISLDIALVYFWWLEKTFVERKTYMPFCSCEELTCEEITVFSEKDSPTTTIAMIRYDGENWCQIIK